MVIQIQEIIYSVVAILCAMLISFTTTPPVRLLAFRIGAIDIPLDFRRMHKKPTPRIGGLAIFAAFVISTLVFCEHTTTLYAIWIGGGILVILGILDDIFRLPALLKFGVQICVAGIVVSMGIVIEYVTVFGQFIEFGVFSIPITILWIVGLSNAVNLIDGLDGLACGVSAITALSVFLVMLITGDTASALITAILVGACLGFLPYNKNPAKIFMGDTGALFLGFALSVISVQGLFKLHTMISILVPLSIFALPIFDTLVAIVRRLLKGQNPFHPDRGHLHHKLVDMGFTQKESVHILYGISGIFGLVAVIFTDVMFNDTSERIWKTIIVLAVAAIIIILNYICLSKPSTRILSGLAEHISEKELEESKKEREEQEEEERQKAEEKKSEKKKKDKENDKETEKTESDKSDE